MRAARERMLCIVTPGWSGGELAVGDPRLTALHALCDDVGVIHFAAVALLPPRPDEPPGARPSLMLELAVDEGLRPDDLLQRLAHHPSGALWGLYGAWWPEVQPVGVGARNEALLSLLQRGLSVADGAFVGPRDLSVGQVRAHRRLSEAMQAQAPRVDPAARSRRDSFALALARWAFMQPEFEALASPAPRSYWRSASGYAKLRMLATRLFVVALGLWLLGALARCMQTWVLPSRSDGLGPALKAGIRASAQAVEWVVCGLLDLGGRGLAVLLAFVVIHGLLFVLLPGLWQGWRRWLDALDHMLDSPGDSPAAHLCRGFGLLLWPWVPALLVLVVFGHRPWLAVLQRWPDAVERGLTVYVALVLAVGLLLAVGLPRPGLGHALATFRAGFTRTQHMPVPGAQQVHASAEESDARLVGGTAHLISLTELRAPPWWSALWTRFFLRLVTLVGHVFFTEGRLGDLRGIQFGHWHVIDEGRRYLFCSNFDGNFGGYLDDFIKGAAGGTTLFWRWTHLLPRATAQPGQPEVVHARRFPPTRLLAYRGVKCEQAFKTYARDSMLPHLFRYDACGLTGQQKMDDRRLRDALFGERNDANDDLLMRALER